MPLDPIFGDWDGHLGGVPEWLNGGRLDQLSSVFWAFGGSNPTNADSCSA
jgi:hypothetical protein